MGPVIGITADLCEERHRVGANYALAISKAGGMPIILPPIVGMENHYFEICDGFIFSGGDDPIMEEWGIATHEKAIPISKIRQTFELNLLRILQTHTEKPVFGICLGMQLMGLFSGGSIEQHLEGEIGDMHSSGSHSIEGIFGTGTVHTNHHQAITHPGSLEIVAVAPDGTIEAIADKSKAWYIGVQWHPEKTSDDKLGHSLFSDFIEAASVAISR